MKKLLILLLGLTLLSCKKSDPNPEMPFDLPQKSAQLIEADNRFGLDLFNRIVAKSDPNDNVMISPLSVSMALSMAYNGASGDTRREMEQTLGFSGLTPEEVNASHKALLSALAKADSDVLLQVANAIYHHQTLQVKNDFISVNRNAYNAEISSLDFGKAASLDIINNWVSEKTAGKIPSILDQLNPDLMMVILNAVYFNGIWKSKFDQNRTHELPFAFGDGSQRNVETMQLESSIAYQSGPLFSAVQLPYGKGRFAMSVLLPSPGKTTADVRKEMSLARWNEWMKGFKETSNVVVQMPRFKFAWELQLNQTLKAMGMAKPFIPRVANFTGISDGTDLFIDFVIHKTYVDVNENGTEAAAVTAVGMSTTSMPVDQPVKTYFIADRPFLFAITEKSTGTILFIGEMNAPSYQ